MFNRCDSKLKETLVKACGLLDVWNHLKSKQNTEAFVQLWYQEGTTKEASMFNLLIRTWEEFIDPDKIKKKIMYNFF